MKSPDPLPVSISAAFCTDGVPGFSELGKRIAGGSGIEELMEDLGRALAEGGEEMCMLGGGNPAHVPEMEALWQRRLQEILDHPAQLRRTLAIYDPPQGNAGFLEALAATLRHQYGWPVGPENLAVTPGGQSAFFFLFNLLGSGPERQILFPVMPEYIGYAPQQLTPGTFRALRPHIERTAPHRFRYHLEMSRLPAGLEAESLAAVCVSRPTNPSGNVLDDEEMAALSQWTAGRGLPFLIDNAYGLPFPGILFRECAMPWAPHHIYVMSLSKLGLPGTRTAVVVAAEKTARAVTSWMAMTGLANGNFGQAITRPLLESGELLRSVGTAIRPFYERKLERALQLVEELLPPESNYALHETGGTMFLWLWLEGAPWTSRQLYERLKERQVLVVPGDPFFFGFPPEEDNWPHRHECLRINYAVEETILRRGLQILGEELQRA
jgi:valine--pyruvate aminotransferase